ncbi:MAG: hypothetical protein OYL41_10985 [Acidobacteriota bacterium]|nr:hypothetical protein [Bryobacterales bacterium]MDE3262492.1 hypothetical protein [Acidobacteriota bacterium]
MTPAGLYLGYDPGGANKHGVAAVEVAREGTIRRVKSSVVKDAGAALQWLLAWPNARALGIDTLLAWSLRGKRCCDETLREAYGAATVIQQNSLFSAMTLNGIMVANRFRRCRDETRLVESHPKLLMRLLCSRKCAGQTLDPGEISVVCHYGRLLARTDCDGVEDHAADALVAAWCASRRETWPVPNLYVSYPERCGYYYPAGLGVSYPWIEIPGTPSWAADLSSHQDFVAATSELC